MLCVQISLKNLRYLFVAVFLFSLKAHAGAVPFGNCSSIYQTSYASENIQVDPKVSQGYTKKIFDVTVPDQTLCSFQITSPDDLLWDASLEAHRIAVGNLDADMPFGYYSILRPHPVVLAAGEVINLPGYNGILYKLTDDWGLGFKPSGSGVYINDARGVGIRYPKIGQYLGFGFIDPDPTTSLPIQVELVKISNNPINSFNREIGLTTFILANEIQTGNTPTLPPTNYTIGTATIEQSIRWAITVIVNGCNPFDVNINLGKIPRTSLGPIGTLGPIISSDLPYLDCINSTKSASISLSPQGDTHIYSGSTNTAIPTQAGAATGVGIQIINGLDNQPFQYGVATRVFNYNPIDFGSLANLLKAQARYVILSNTVTPGKLNSTFQFTITYD